MKIGLISDTHSPAMGRVPPVQVASAFAGVDLILHAGDIFSSECLDWLELIAPVKAAEESPSPLFADPRVAHKAVIEAGGYAIGLVHDLMIRGVGWEVVPGIMAAKFPPDWSLPALLEGFFGRPVDIVIHGHTHVSMSETHQGILIVNPGSPTLPNQTRRLGTVGILELTPAGREARIVNLADY